ncbi:isoleucine--tRNA ligase [Lepagella muris]|jgi:isoleucyl-tRNA synthetase|uniref:Isoleucine--tRNA ligase n=2 Tax=Muribaculaceae TaxID=2005473 RepID=A0AC61RJ81_9BACT|nr:isoleucine--tRNA ligase [Lepagella muris]TGY79717.1 isoleucine--tRNA ligase [Lepagella muris]THG51212.1 isoleucine--tRNA ligase [Bacteroidales bacterium]TKC54815.1 isoleucine--tRNA ligase [Bacteroidales bacterium]
MSKKFKEYSKQLNLSEVNKEMLQIWDEHSLFEASMKEREGCPTFVFYEGPPSANGMPGIHHVMARTIKDIVCRYKTMKGFHVKRKAGWDTHGLPVELGVEKSLGITKEDIGKKISVDEYNAACRSEVMKYTKEWTDLTHKMGYWVDLENPYITYDNKYIESVWWLLRQLYDKGYLFKGYTIQPYSPAAGTGLSSHELNQPGCYRDVKDTTATVLFKIKDAKPEMEGWGTPCFMAWTTTPWTLPSNTALCVGPSIDYVAVRTYNPYTADKLTVVLAESLLKAYFKPEGEKLDLEAYNAGDKILPYKVVGKWRGPELVGMHYEQLMPWVKPVERVDDRSAEYVKNYASSHPENVFSYGNDRFVEIADEAFRVISGDYVTTEDGTGIVHIAPTFGADDAKVAKAAGIPPLFMINQKGETRPMVDFTGKYYTVDELAPVFVEKCVNLEEYSRHAGDYVKNAYDPKFNPGGKYDEASAMKSEDLNIVLCMEMKKSGEAFKIEKHTHNYPHCWRTDKPVLYYPLDSWFIRTTAARERLIELNERIKWKPASTGSGRFGKWLENLQDWNLSRSRYWGTPLPIWRSEDGREEICIGSYEELYNEIEKSVAAGVMENNPLKDKGFIPGDYTKANYDKIDLHRPYVDDIVLVSASGKPMKRELDLIDVWFDSGSMPYAQIHYPFENKEILDNGEVYPADFIAEGVDQTRGWFFTLHAIAGMVFDTNSFKAVISNGLVLDKNGNKMSKRLGNAIDPFNNLERFGSDPVRWYMISNSSPWDNLKYDEAGVAEVSRKLFATLYNTYKFFALYANVDGFTGSEPPVATEKRPEIDRWILSLLNTLVAEVTDALDDYEPTKAARAIEEFVNDNLSNWYVRLNRKRFWAGEMDDDKLSAYQTLYTSLKTVALLMAPFAPFYSDRLYSDLVAPASESEGYASVHTTFFPESDSSMVDSELEERMRLAQEITSNVLALRRKVNLKVRQPLQTLLIPVMDSHQRAGVEALEDLIKSEVNIKELKIVENEESGLVKRVKADFKKLGPKYGKIMKQLGKAITELSQKEIARLEREGELRFTDLEGEPVVTLSDVEIIPEDVPGWLVANDGNITVALDVTVTPELKNEGMARELINRIQNIRKGNDFEITDKVRVELSDEDEIKDAVNAFRDYISAQVLADEIIIVPSLDGQDCVDLEIDGLKAKARVTKN